MKKDSSFLDSVRLFLDKNGKPLVPWVNLTPAELCEAEKISHDALAELHDSPDPDAAPPRYRVSPRRWGYPLAFICNGNSGACPLPAQTNPNASSLLASATSALLSNNPINRTRLHKQKGSPAGRPFPETNFHGR